MSLMFQVLIQTLEIGFQSIASQLLHVAGYALLDALSDLSVTLPGQTKPLQQESKLVIFHTTRYSIRTVRKWKPSDPSKPFVLYLQLQCLIPSDPKTAIAP
jgi:hypothetical protein